MFSTALLASAFHVPIFVTLACAAALIYMIDRTYQGRSGADTEPTKKGHNNAC